MTAQFPDPQGPTQQKWFREGYQRAMAELFDILERDGTPFVVEWIENNHEINN